MSLARRYKLDGNYADATGNGSAGVASGVPSFVDALAQLDGQALYLTTATVVFSDRPTLTNKLSIELLASLSDWANGNQTLIAIYDPGVEEREFMLRVTGSGELELLFGDPAGSGGYFGRFSSTDEILVNGEAAHIAAVFVGTQAVVADRVRLYINGRQLATSVGDGGAPTSLYAGSADLVLGAYQSSGTPVQFMTGTIDDVRVYDSVRTAAEVYQAAVATGVTERANITFASNYTDTIGGLGSSPSEQGTGDITIVPVSDSTVPGIRGAVQFPGSNERLDYGDVLDLGLSDRTIDFWFKTTDSAGVFVAKGWSETSNQHACRIYLGNLYVLIDFDDGGGDDIIVTSTAINDDEWHYFALTMDRDGYAALYLDGEQIGTPHDISNRATHNEQDSYPFTIGGPRDGTPSFAGQMALLRICDHVRTAEEIAARYLQITSSVHAAVRSPVRSQVRSPVRSVVAA